MRSLFMILLFRHKSLVLSLSGHSRRTLNTSTRVTLGMKIPSFFGGDFAGHSATISPTTGKVIPVPEYLVPESMVEWGQIPSSLECITSEDYVEDDSLTLERRTIIVLPEVGCGIDNLETQSKCENFKLENAEQFDFGKAEMGVLYQKGQSGQKYRRLDVTINEKVPFLDSDCANESFLSRIRLTINIDPSSNQIQSPINLVKERKTSDQSSRGQIADGGGLDARTVTSLIGKANVNKPFTDRKVLSFEEVSGEGSQFFQTFMLPGHVLVEYDDPMRVSPWRLKISFFNQMEDATLVVIGSTTFSLCERGEHKIEFGSH